MDVILLERVEKLGRIGDVVSVKPGFARNFLLPRGKAPRVVVCGGGWGGLTTAASLRRSICPMKLPLPHAGSKKRESMRSDSSLTRSSMASTIHAGVKTSPWSATRCFDLTRLISWRLVGACGQRSLQIPMGWQH